MRLQLANQLRRATPRLRSLPSCLAAAATTLATAAATAQCTGWNALGAGTNNTVLAVAATSSGELVAGGVFTSAGGTAASRIAWWDGGSWSALGSGVDNAVRSLTTLPNGDLIAAGDFSTAGGVAASRIARWDGSAWHPLGTGISSASLYGLYAVTTLPNGDVVAGGYFTSAGGVPANAIARWNGASWAPLGSGLPGTVFALTVAQNGDLLAGGNFSSAGGVPASRVARWNGSSWAPLGSGTNGDVLALQTLPNGDLLAAGQFSTAGGTAALAMARWNGSTWSPLGFSGFAEVYALAANGNAERFVGGAFFNAGGSPAAFVATYGSSCLAEAVDTGGGCAGSGGNNQLAPVTEPWAGSTFRSHGSGLPTNSLALVITGFDSTSLPLSLVLPPSPPACSLRVTPDFLDVAVPIGGQLDLGVSIPFGVQFHGFELHQQLVLLELAAGTGALVQTTASNRVLATVGVF